MALIMLLDAIQDFLEDKLKNVQFLVKPDEDDDETPAVRGVRIFQQRMPNPDDPTPYIPCVLLQMMNGEDKRLEDGQEESRTVVRFIVTLYDPDPEEGAKALSNLISTMRYEMEQAGVVGGRYELMRPMQYQFIVDNTLPYHLAEMMTEWRIPSVERVVPELSLDNW